MDRLFQWLIDDLELLSNQEKHGGDGVASHFVTSMTAPIASGWSGCRVGLAPTGKRRLCTAHTHLGRRLG